MNEESNWLEDWIGHGAAQARDLAIRLRKWLAQNPLGSIVVAFLVLSLLLVTIWGLWPNSAPEFTGFGETTDSKVTTVIEKDGQTEKTVETTTDSAKTLWDWMDLLIVSVVIAVGLFLLNKRQKERETVREEDEQRQETLRQYFDKMSDLLLEHNLSETSLKKARFNKEMSPEDPKRAREAQLLEMAALVARARTLDVLRSLDRERVNAVAEFLQETKLTRVVSLAGADLSAVNWRGARLQGVDLTSANLTKANLSSVNLRRATLSKATLVKADLTNADLREAYCYEVNLHSAGMSWCQLSGAKLPDADLIETDLRYANLESADLSFAKLNDAVVYKTNLKGAQLSRANLTGIDLAKVDLTGARYDPHTKWPSGFDYERCGAIGPGANLKGVSLTGIDLGGVDLRRVDLSEVDLAGAKYNSGTSWPIGFEFEKSGAIGPNAKLVGVDLSDEVLTKADLQGADLSRADLRGADLSAADLRGTNLDRTDLIGVDLTWADASGASFVGSNLRPHQMTQVRSAHKAIMPDGSGLAEWASRLHGKGDIDDVTFEILLSRAGAEEEE